MNNVFRDATKCDAGDLIRIADAAAAVHNAFVYVRPESVRIMWGWLERTDVLLYALVLVADVSADNVFARVSDVLKAGAAAATLDVGNVRNLAACVSDLFFIRDDLFFSRRMFFRLDMDQIAPDDWTDIWFNIKKSNADGAAFVVPSDFVGGIFALFDSVPADFSGELHFFIDNPDMAESIVRIHNRMRAPDAEIKLYFIM